MLETLELDLILEGNGETKEKALVEAIGKVQKEVIGKLNSTVIKIEPITIEFLEGKEYIYTEKFMFFFFKRERTKYYLKLAVKVRVSAADFDKCKFVRV